MLSAWSPCSSRSISPCGSPTQLAATTLKGSWSYDVVYLPTHLGLLLLYSIKLSLKNKNIQNFKFIIFSLSLNLNLKPLDFKTKVDLFFLYLFFFILKYVS